MKMFAAAYGTTALIVLVLDAAWLTFAGPRFYKPAMGGMALDGFNLAPAIAFYMLYVAGVVHFAVLPGIEAGRWQTALLQGAALGLVAYGTYDLTNQAVLKVWPTWLTVMDMAWGTLLTALSAGLAAYILGAGR